MLSSFRVSLRFAYKLKKKQNKIKDFQAEFIAHAFAGWWTRVFLVDAIVQAMNNQFNQSINTHF